MDAKTKAIVAHITLIGWIIALVVNSSNKEELSSFYIRQMLGLIVLGFGLGILSFIPIIGLIASIASLGVIVLWVISLIGAASGEERSLPVVGEYFQEWFASL